MLEHLVGQAGKFFADPKSYINKIYDLSPAAWQATRQEEMNIRAEQREQAYNSPTAQLQRLKDAGLNPALMYGGGASASATGNVQSKQGSVGSPAGILGMIFQAIQVGTNAAVRGTQAAVNAARVPNIEASTKLLEQNYEYLQKVNPDLAKIVRNKQVMSYVDRSIAVGLGQDMAWEKYRELLKRNDLLDQDGKIREEILRGKTIINDLNKIEKDWLQDGEFTSQKFWELFLRFIKK